jgi:Tol biopolymer transport system component
MRGSVLAAGAVILVAGGLLVHLRSAGAAPLSVPPPTCCFRIFVINADGTRQSVLTRGAEGVSAPAWSPNGKKIAYNGIVVMNADGSGVTRLPAGLDPAWSPDGRKIAFAYNGDIYIMTARGTVTMRLTYRGGDNGGPAWSPDGRKIAFARRTGDFDIYVVNADGSAETRLTTGPAYEDDPAWSPDGTRIVFHRFGVGETPEIYVMRADGSGQGPLPNRAYGITPAWSPGGRRIAFVDGGISVMRADGSGQSWLADGSSPTWSPGGRKLAFSRRTDPESCIVPDVVGRSLSVARSTLRRLGCPVGPIRRVRSMRPRLTVLRQIPAPASTLDLDGVYLFVSRGRR